MTKREINKEIKRLTKTVRALAKANITASIEHEKARQNYTLACKGTVSTFTLDKMEKEVTRLYTKKTEVATQFARANAELINLTKMIKK